MRFIVGPFEQRLLQLTLQQLHEAVGVRVVVDATVNRKRTHKQTISECAPSVNDPRGQKQLYTYVLESFSLKGIKGSFFRNFGSSLLVS